MMRRFDLGVLPLAVATLCCVALGVTPARAAAIITQFQGATLSQSGFVPPDMGLSVGDGYAVQLLNGVATIDTTAGQQVSQTSLNAIFHASGQVSDPRVIFDPSSQLWFASAVTITGGSTSSPNSILLAVSSGANPTAGFRALAFGSANSTTFADFPTLGVNGAAVTIATNDFSTATGAFIASSVYSIPKASLTATTPTLAGQTNFIQNAASVGLTAQAVTNAAAGGTSTSVLSTASLGANQVYALSTIAGANAPGATLSLTQTYTQPGSSVLIAPTQPGGATYAPGDTRIGSTAFQSGNYIYIANTVSNGISDQISWLVLNATNKAVQASGIITIPGESLTYGSISGNAAGTFVVAFNGSGTTQNITDYYAICSVSTGSCGSPQIDYTSPANNYVNSPAGSNRWGDYSVVTIDPTNPNNFWLGQQYALTNSSWGTVVTQIATGASVPEPAGFALFAAGLTGLLFVRRRKMLSRPR